MSEGDRLAAIKARLEAATKGPWALKRGHRLRVTSAPIEEVCWTANHQDATFIAHAPEDIAYLLGRVEELKEAISPAGNAYLKMQGQLGMERATVRMMTDTNRSLQDRISSLEAEVARLNRVIDRAASYAQYPADYTDEPARLALLKAIRGLSGSGEGG